VLLGCRMLRFNEYACKANKKKIMYKSTIQSNVTWISMFFFIQILDPSCFQIGLKPAGPVLRHFHITSLYGASCPHGV
jgi:hypothetical protein